MWCWKDVHFIYFVLGVAPIVIFLVKFLLFKALSILYASYTMYSMLCHSGFDYTVCSNSLHLLLSILLEYVKTPIYWSILTIMLSIVPVSILTCSFSTQFLKCDKGISGFGFWLTSNLFSVFRVYVRC